VDFTLNGSGHSDGLLYFRRSMKYDVAIIGGGLAGLAVAILSAKAGYSVVVFEKDSYPMHKVCGEYISMESYGFLESLGLDLDSLNLPLINKLNLSSPSGRILEHKMKPGGFGISRYKLDAMLAKLAREAGALVLENSKVNDVSFSDDEFSINTSSTYKAQVAVASYGKRSNLDVKWERDFIRKKPSIQNNLIGIKYHVQYDMPNDMIALHNFKDGYCGISAIEEDKYCLCYLTTASALRRNNNSISALQQSLLSKNPHLKRIFTEAKFLWSAPVTISQISFDKKTLVEDHILFAGDAAGMITPLCGNGMSMALNAGKIAFECLSSFLTQQVSREQMEIDYQIRWKNAFAKRISFGRRMQNFFGKNFLTNFFISAIKPFPRVTDWLVSQSHGDPF
jgi:menaquinone-9 beta-reductase